MNIRMDTYFNENDLYENGAIDSVLERLDQKGLTYKQDGALWVQNHPVR